ncbi:hypothetical protein [Spiroplasma floricola]|uniref:Lipoprotein n=1 Tax=Spiroplasma floricola 23-6 TaxID=1336749 RepID=A0A2K8SH29_9MOLU|nr:hypothetical protein [Spiroplasma floricola]AUB32130.1 hypothetical protein SFLOR_v1c10840 [Spiroplasma floricola 23-6]
MKKLLNLIAAFSMTAMSTLTLTSCQIKEEKEVETDKDFFMETEQPKSIEEIEEKIKVKYDDLDYWREIAIEKLYKWKVENDYFNKTKQEQAELEKKFDATCIEQQKFYIYMAWNNIYEYKIQQFIPNLDYKKTLYSPKGKKIRLIILKDENSIKWFYKIKNDLINSLTPKKIVDHFEKMEKWALTENPNTKK